MLLENNNITGGKAPRMLQWKHFFENFKRRINDFEEMAFAAILKRHYSRQATMFFGKMVGKENNKFLNAWSRFCQNISNGGLKNIKLIIRNDRALIGGAISSYWLKGIRSAMRISSMLESIIFLVDISKYQVVLIA